VFVSSLAIAFKFQDTHEFLTFILSGRKIHMIFPEQEISSIVILIIWVSNVVPLLVNLY